MNDHAGTPQQQGFDAARCQQFIKATAGRPTPELILRAMELARPGGDALELGCGAGDDALSMLERGFSVTVVDEHSLALDAARRLAEDAGFVDRLTVRETTFEAFCFASNRFDLINARFSIPFCTTQRFPGVWSGIRRTLRPGGVLTGQLFGPRDSFVIDPARHRIVGHTRAEMDVLLDDLQILHFEEVEKDGHTATGHPKHWHVYHLILRRPETKPKECQRRG